MNEGKLNKLMALYCLVAFVISKQFLSYLIFTSVAFFVKICIPALRKVSLSSL